MAGFDFSSFLWTYERFVNTWSEKSNITAPLPQRVVIKMRKKKTNKRMQNKKGTKNFKPANSNHIWQQTYQKFNFNLSVSKAIRVFCLFNHNFELNRRKGNEKRKKKKEENKKQLKNVYNNNKWYILYEKFVWVSHVFAYGVVPCGVVWCVHYFFIFFLAFKNRTICSIRDAWFMFAWNKRNEQIQVISLSQKSAFLHGTNSIQFSFYTQACLNWRII